MLDFGENFGTEFSEWILDFKGLFDPDSVSRKISDYLEENPVPEKFHNTVILFYYDFNVNESFFKLSGLTPLSGVKINYNDMLQKINESEISDFENILDLVKSDIQGGADEFNEWSIGLAGIFDIAEVSDRVYGYVKKHPVPKDSNLVGMSFVYDLSTKMSALMFDKVTPRRDMRAKSAGKLQKGTTLSGFKECLYSFVDEFDFNATLIFADDLKELQSLYFRSVVGNEDFSDSYSSSELKGVLEKDSSKFGKNYTGFRLYNNNNDFFVVYRKVGSEAVLVNTSLRKSQLSAKKILSYF